MYFFDCSSPPPYRPYSSASLIDLPGPKLQTAGGITKSATANDVLHPDVEEKITPSQASDTNQAYVIGLHAV